MLISEAQEREIHKLLPQTHCPGVDVLLPLHHGVDGDVVGEGGDLSGSAPPEFSPSNLQLLISVSWFLCFGGALFRESPGGVYI